MDLSTSHLQPSKSCITQGREAITWCSSWLLNSISKDIATSVIYVNTAKEMWTDLKQRFSQNNGSQIFQLHKAISSHSQGNMTMSSYYTLVKGLWDDLSITSLFYSVLVVLSKPLMIIIIKIMPFSLSWA